MTAELELIGIVCEKTTAADDVDEIYLEAGYDLHSCGRIWGPESMDEGNAENSLRQGN